MTMLSHTNKPTKKEAFALVMQLKNGHHLSGYDVDSLLNYFAPPQPKKPKTAIQWVAMAAGKNDVRQFLNTVRVQAGMATACDGHRMHECATDLDDGFYDPKTLCKVDTTDFVGKYPDTSRLWAKTTTADDALKCHTRDKNLIDIPQVVELNDAGIRCVQTGQGQYQEKYWLAATQGDARLCTAKNGKAIGRNKFGSFIIMGMRED